LRQGRDDRCDLRTMNADVPAGERKPTESIERTLKNSKIFCE